MRNLSVPKTCMLGKHFIRMRNRGSRDETWDDAHFKSIARKILCGHRIRETDTYHPYLPTRFETSLS